ncbi:MAG: GIY-YIG nuclease family protein [Thermofilaceae archaeon]
MDLPRSAGVYALLLRVSVPLHLSIRGLQYRLEPGYYVYVGSARGPGGLRARVERHLRRAKRLRWHIDQITGGADAVMVFYAETRESECVLVPPLEADGFEHPIPGFGASDCRRKCRSHLLKCSGDLEACTARILSAFERAGLKPKTVKITA